MDVTIESLRDGDEEQRQALLREAFGGTTPHDPEAPTFPADRLVAAYRGDELVASVATHEFAQTWSGARVPCGGVSAMIVAPHARGAGIAQRMLVESLDRMADRGEILSALYPTTATLYRSVGYEVAGWWRQSRIDGSLLPLGAAESCSWRRGEPDDPALAEVVAAMADHHDGWLHLPPLWWQYRAARARAESGVNRYIYIGERDGSTVAALQFRQVADEDSLYALSTEVLAGRTGTDVAAALGFLARHGTTAPRVSTTVPPEVLGLHVPHQQQLAQVAQWPWMIRLVDVAACLERRPVSAAVSGQLSLHVHDGLRPANDGPGILHVGDGRLRWERGGPGQVVVGVTDLAALFAGADPRSLAAVGRLPGAHDDDLALLRATFAATPTLPDFF